MTELRCFSKLCIEKTCRNFPTQAISLSVLHSLNISNDGTNVNWGTVNFTIFTLEIKVDEFYDAVN